MDKVKHVIFKHSQNGLIKENKNIFDYLLLEVII